MKRTILVAFLCLLAGTMWALPYDEARDRAWFLTDKMAYELNLSDAQYERAYQINLDYLLSIDRADDCSGAYWQFRNADLQCVLTNAQYQLYTTISYFLRPITWVSSGWYFPIVKYYRPTLFYYSRPAVYISYTGHRWHSRRIGAPSPYRGFRPNRWHKKPLRVHRPAPGYNRPHHDGMRPGVTRPDRKPRPGAGRPTPNRGNRPNVQRPGRDTDRKHLRPQNNRPSRTDRGNARPTNEGKRTYGNRGGNR